MIIGEVLIDRYQVVGKLGFGVSSTVRLARDMQRRRYVALKVYTRGEDHDREFEASKTISEMETDHPGFSRVRSALGSFTITRDGGDHRCLVQRPMWDSFGDMLHRRQDQRFTEDLLKAAVETVLLALDFLHTECKLVHTDIKCDNILTEVDDPTILDKFVKAEMRHPSPRKVTGGATVYASRTFDQPKMVGMPVLSDIGEAVS